VDNYCKNHAPALPPDVLGAQSAHPPRPNACTYITLLLLTLRSCILLCQIQNWRLPLNSSPSYLLHNVLQWLVIVAFHYYFAILHCIEFTVWFPLFSTEACHTVTYSNARTLSAPITVVITNIMSYLYYYLLNCHFNAFIIIVILNDIVLQYLFKIGTSCGEYRSHPWDAHDFLFQNTFQTAQDCLFSFAIKSKDGWHWYCSPRWCRGGCTST